MTFLSLLRPAMMVAACLSLVAPLRAQEAVQQPRSAAVDPNIRLRTLIGEAQSLHQRQRYFDALAKLEEAEGIDPKQADIYNIRGSIYLAEPLRDLNKARAQFNKAGALRPDDPAPYFNLGEVEYVGGKWPEAEQAFKKVLEKFPKLPSTLRHLVVFKTLVALAKQDKVAEAEKLLAASFTFMDDTPAYYFSKAVLAMQQKDEKAGREWLVKGRIIFKQQDVSAYFDSLQEAHYVDSLTTAKPDETAEPAKP